MRRIRFVLVLVLVALAASAPVMWGDRGAVASFGADDPSLAYSDEETAGYWVIGANGAVIAFGAAEFLGSPGPVAASAPISAAAATPSGRGYWLAAANGGLFGFGDAGFHGSMSATRLNAPIVSMAATPTGGGYWFLGADGGIFSFGDARFFGSTGDIRLNQPVMGMAPTPTGNGYWFVASDGGIFAYGDAGFYGSMGATPLNRPIVAMAATPTGQGYWLVAADGGIFAFGDAGFFGSTGDLALKAPVIGMATAPTGTGGYWLVTSNGGIFAFGDASFFGQAPGPGPYAAMIPLPPATPVRPFHIPDEPATTTTQTISAFGRDPTTTTTARQPFDVGLVGDTGYSSAEEDDFLAVRQHMNGFPLAFTVHDGDIWGAQGSCSDSHYKEILAVFDGFAHPFVYTPGDNEWMDCGGDEEEHLEDLRRVFFASDQSRGQTRISLARQPGTPENARWSRSGVVFATLNVPGPVGLHRSLNAPNLAWLDAAFDEAEATRAPAVMIIWQDNPFVPSGSPLLDALEDRAAAFGRPVMLVHGETHNFRVRQRFRHVTEVETFAGPASEKWVRVTVDPKDPEVFTVHEMGA